MSAAHPFRILTDWRVKGRMADVLHLLTTMEEFPNWWGDVYARISPEGQGSYSVRARSRLHLPMRWHAQMNEVDLPYLWTVDLRGGLTGRGIWHLRQAGEVVEIAHDWQPIARPRFGSFGSATHRWVMARGQVALRREIDRLGRMGNMPILGTTSADQAAHAPRLTPVQ